MGFAQLLGQPAPGWQGRIKEGAYTSPSGTRIPFIFTIVSRETTKRTAEFECVDLDEGYVQDNGHGSRKYPLTCIFSGSNHDQIATAFEAALLEKGIGHLEHPLYGSFDAIPLGTITRRNDLVSEGNQSVIEVTFSTTLARAYPAGQSFPKNEILASLDAFNLAAALAFEDNVMLDTVGRRAEFKNTLQKILGEIRSSFDKAQGITAEVRQEMAAQQRAINEAIDVLIGSPLLLAQAVSNLILTPGRMMQGFISRIQGYGRMLNNIVANHSDSSGDGTTLPEALIGLKNEYFLSDFVSLTGVAGGVLSTTDTDYETRPQSLESAETIIGQLGTAVTWRDDRAESLSDSTTPGATPVIDTGGAYQAIQEAVALAAGYLVESSFELVPERQIVLDRDRTIIDVCAEIYGTTSNDRLDFMIRSNDLSGDQILELKRGDLIRYYIAA